MKSKVIILGINGFTGWHLRQYIQKHKLTDKYSFVGAGKTAVLEVVMKKQKPDYIINLAGILRSDALDDLVQVNAGVSRNILDIILKHKIKVKKVLFIGSAAEYGLPDHLPVNEKAKLNPVSGYGLSKVIQSQYADYYFKNYGIELNIARTFNVIGKFISPSLSIGSFLNQIKNTKNGGDIHVGNLKTRRDFIDIEDAVDGYWKILLKGKSGEAYNLCSGKSVRMKDVLAHMIKRSGKRINVVVKREYLKKGDVLDIYGDYTKVKRDTGWKPVTDLYSSLDKLDYK